MKKKYSIHLARTLLLSLFVWSMASCSKSGENIQETNTATVQIGLALDKLSTRAFANDGNHRVNRVLILPFQKTSEELTDDDANFVPAYSLAKQMDIAQFPVSNADLQLIADVTYQVLVIGYNQTDYDFADPSAPANTFSMGTLNTPATLANFDLYPKAATDVPEFFVAVCNVYDGVNPVGSAFRPDRIQAQGYTVSGDLTRLVSGFSVAVSNIPPIVQSISLVAENLTKASKATDGSVLLAQTTGDSESRLLGEATPDAEGNISFNKYLLPTFDAGKTGFYLDINFGSSTERYEIKVTDRPGVAVSNRFILSPNSVINLTGNYETAINLGFDLGFNINLDDNSWDGYQ